MHRIVIYKRGMLDGVTANSKLIAHNMDAVHALQVEFDRRTGVVAPQMPNSATDLRDQAKAGAFSLKTQQFERR